MHDKHIPNIFYKTVPWMHFEFILYSLIVRLYRSIPSDWVYGFPRFSNESPVTGWVTAFKRPPVDPTGALKIDTSTQEGENTVFPVHKHFPSMHAPFLLQWNGQVVLLLQNGSNALGQVRVPEKPGGAGIVCPYVLHTSI